MKDTRETLAYNLNVERVPAYNENHEDIPENLRPAPRFKSGDVVVHAAYPDREFTLHDDSAWDYEFQGWQVYPGFIGVHESNFVLSSDRDKWTPHGEGFGWSYWTLKEGE